MPLEFEQCGPVDSGRELAIDLLGRQQEFSCELVCLSLDFFDTPDLLSMNHEMSKFVCPVEARAGTVILVGAQDHYRVVGERDRCLIERISKDDDDGVDAGAIASGYRVIRALSDPK